MKAKPSSKTIFAKPTEPMRRIPADKDRSWPDYIDPKHDKTKTDGWLRLCEVLKDAMSDERIRSSVGASDFLEVVYELAADAFTADDAMQALKPIRAILAGDLLKDNSGGIDGGETMKRLKEAHTNDLRAAVTDILKNPKTSDWSDPEIARWLMKPERAYHERKGKTPLGLKTMTTRVKEIRADYKASF